MSKYMIKDIPIEERPRERMKSSGKSSLSNKELLAIILKTGTKEKSVNELAIDILNKYTLEDLEEISLNKLLEIKGIGEVKAIELLASIELGRRMFLNKDIKYKRLDTPKKIFNHTKYLFYNKKQELFYTLYFNNKQELIGEKLLFVGTINRSVTHPREIFKEAYRLSASSIVCMHNHPSNDVTPSNEDIIFTEKLVSLGTIQGIPIVDHIVVGNNSFYSFYEHGQIISLNKE